MENFAASKLKIEMFYYFCSPTKRLKYHIITSQLSPVLSTFNIREKQEKILIIKIYRLKVPGDMGIFKTLQGGE